MMKLTFELIATTNLNAFNELVNKRLAEGWKFMADKPQAITPHEDISGKGFQYSVPMILEEEV